ncbi:MarR family transcriptional regulator, partial [Bacillus amyloliquefaciens]|nr:MarR family transcriptional regulator [Bacillus amyloliquefaciens]
MKVRTQMMYDMGALLRKMFKQIRNEVNEILDKELSRNEFTILRILSE